MSPRPGMRLHRARPADQAALVEARHRAVRPVLAFGAASIWAVGLGGAYARRPDLVAEPLPAALFVAGFALILWMILHRRPSLPPLEVWIDDEGLVLRIPGIATEEIARAELIAVQQGPGSLVLERRSPGDRLELSDTIERFDALAARLAAWAPQRPYEPRPLRLRATAAAIFVGMAALFAGIQLPSPYGDVAAGLLTLGTIAAAVAVARGPLDQRRRFAAATLLSAGIWIPLRWFLR